MSLVLPRRKSLASPVGGKLALNREHPFYEAVQFAWSARANIGMQDLTGRARLSAGSAAAFGSAGGISGVKHAAANCNLSYVIPSERVSVYTGPVTLVWRGVLLGAKSGSSPALISVFYGDGGSAPYEIAGMAPDPSNGRLYFQSSSGSNWYPGFTTDFALGSRYNVPFVVACSNDVATSTVRAAIAFDNDDTSLGFQFATFNLSGTPSDPRPSTTNNTINIGGYAADSSRYINGITESAMILNRAFPNQEMLADFVRSYGDMYRVVGAQAAREAFLSTTTAPEIAVTGNGNNIVDGDATPSATDHTDFGTITEAGATLSRTFTITNSGDADLVISSVTVPTGYTITTNPTGTITPSGTASLIVRLDSTTPGTKSGDITINNNDANEGTFNFAVTGTVTAINPEISVTGNSLNIADGDNTPSTADFTDFGSVAQGSSRSRNFVIANTGDENLTITSVALSGTGAAQFTITADPTGTIAPSGTATLTVRADADNQGTFAATVTINNDDADEGTFNFDIAVVVTAPVEGGGAGGGSLFGSLNAMQSHPRTNLYRRKFR